MLNRYLLAKPTLRKNLWLVGITVVQIACKHEEIHGIVRIQLYLLIAAPKFNRYVYSNTMYTVDQINAMEQDILVTLQFKLGGPSPLSFLRCFPKAVLPNYEVYCLSMFLLEVTIVDINSLKYSSSLTFLFLSHIQISSVRTCCRCSVHRSSHEGRCFTLERYT